MSCIRCSTHASLINDRGEQDKMLNHKNGKTKQEKATNEFNQIVVGNSLSKDAWRRLRKNKMAVISVILVSIYILLAVTAPILPIYPYDEIVIDHQDLPPSLTKTAGELMRDKELAKMYAQAWRQGRLVVDEATNEMLEDWVSRSKVNKVWDYLLPEGNRQLESGTFTWNASEQRSIDSREKRIANEIQISIEKMWLKDEQGKLSDVKHLETDEIVALYAKLLGVQANLLVDQYTYEIEMQLLKKIKAESTGLTDDEYNMMLRDQLDSMSTKNYDALVKENIYEKIASTIKDMAMEQLGTEASQAETTYPLNEKVAVTEYLTASVKATKMHDRRYYLGTDSLGRDMLSRIIYGGQVSIAIGFIGTLTSVLIGVILGSLAGYLGGKIDYFIMRVVDIMYGLPYMLLVIIAMAIFGRNILNLFFALAIISWLTISRMVRGQIMSLKNQEFVEAARSMGASTPRIIFKHLVPNSLSVIIVFSTLRIPSFIMTESFLSFLGLGVQAPYASWGSLVGESVGGMTLYPWRLFFPAIVMTVFLFAMNFLGDGLRDAFDPQSKNQL